MHTKLHAKRPREARAAVHEYTIRTGKATMEMRKRDTVFSCMHRRTRAKGIDTCYTP